MNNPVSGSKLESDSRVDDIIGRKAISVPRPPIGPLRNSSRAASLRVTMTTSMIISYLACPLLTLQ